MLKKKTLFGGGGSEKLGSYVYRQHVMVDLQNERDACQVSNGFVCLPVDV